MQQSMAIPAWDSLPQDLSWREKVALLTYRFSQMEQTETGLHHLFEDGRYIREMTIPAETLFVGRVHRHGHEVQLLKGQVILIGPEGFTMGKQAPDSVFTGPGFQMVCFTLTDVLARTIHPNPDDLRDTEALETDAFESAESLVKLGAQLEQRLLT